MPPVNEQVEGKHMRAMVLDSFGGPDVLHLADIACPFASPGNVVIQVAYAGVNPADWKSREGWLAAYFQYQFPFVVGFDATGVIVQIGAGVSGFSIGDRVVTASNQGLGERGTYAEFVRSAAERVARLPDNVSLQDAATLPTAGMTAWEATIDVGKATAGSIVVVNGGAGGTGSFAVQIAMRAGATVIATCSAGNFDYVRSLGADHAVDYRAGDVYAAIRALAPDGVDLVVDTVGQGSFIGALSIMKRGGIIAPIGTLIADEATIDPAAAQDAGVTIVPTMSNFVNQPRQLRGLVAGLANGSLRAPETVVMPLAEAGEAHRRIQSGHVRGKILLEVAAGRA
jgi:NADPH:quinone reductase-like Zn-dependent oxidoreductase